MYVCDDDPVFLTTMEKQLHYYLENTRLYDIAFFKNGRELIRRWNEQFADVVFLDVDMPGLDGFDIASQLIESNKDVIIIFVTNHDDLVYQVWDYKPFWFLRKSHLSDLENVLRKLLNKLDVDYLKKKCTCFLKTDARVFEIDINTLVSIESSQHNLIMKDVFGNETTCRCKIAYAEEQLLPYYILRIQKGILINFRFIAKVTSRNVILSNGHSFKIGRDRVDDVRKQFQNYMRSI